MKLIDLSQTLNSSTPVYPGDPPLEIKQIANHESDGYQDHGISMGSAHIGTHIDAPSHFVAGGKVISQIALENFIGRGRVVDTDEFNKSSTEEYEGTDILLIKTGVAEGSSNADYFDKTKTLSVKAIENLTKTSIKIVGVDQGTPDTADDFPVHMTLLSAGILIIENLCNLSELPESGFTVYALPVKTDIDGAPARVIAQIN